MHRQSRYFAFDAIDDSGCRLHGTCRAWLAPSGMWRWELRRIILSGGYASRKGLHIHKVVQVEGAQWDAAFQDLQLDPSVSFARSARSVQSRGEAAGIGEDLASLSSPAVLTLHLFWVEFRRELSRKVAVKCMLRTLLERALAADDAKARRRSISDVCLVGWGSNTIPMSGLVRKSLPSIANIAWAIRAPGGSRRGFVT